MKNKNTSLKEVYREEKRIEDFFSTGGRGGNRIGLENDTGKLILTPCHQSVKFVEIKSGRPVCSVSAAELQIEDQREDFMVNFDYCHSKLIVIYNSGLLRHWRIDIELDNDQITRVDHVLLRTWKSLHVGLVARVLLDLTGTLVATGGSDGTIKIWDIVNNYCTHNLKEAQGVISTLIFSPSITESCYFLLGSGDDYAIHVWNLMKNDGQHHVAALRGHESKVTDVVFTSDSSKFISASRDKLIMIWHAKSPFERLRTIAVFESIESICLIKSKKFSTVLPLDQSNDGQVLVTAGESGFIKLWNLDTGNHLYTTKSSKQPSSLSIDEESSRQYTLINQLHFNSHNDQLLAVSFDNTVTVYDCHDLAVSKQMVGSFEEVLDIKFIGDDGQKKSSIVAIATNSPKIKIMHLDSLDCRILNGHSDIVLALAVLPRDPWVMVSSSKDNTVRVWRFDQTCLMAHCLLLGTGHTHSVISLATSHLNPNDSNDFFLSGSEDTTLKFWKIPSLTNIGSDSQEPAPIVSKFTQSCHERIINCLDVSPNNQLAATGSQDKTAKLWSLPALKLVGVFRGHQRGVWHVQFSPSDQVLATCSADTSIKIWSITSFACLKTFQGHSSSVLKLQFIDEGMQFITSSSDGNLKIWNMKSNECVATLDAHDGKVWALALSKDEEQLVTGADDSQLKVWRNVTREEQEKEALNSETIILEQQTLQNLLQKKSWFKALKLSIRLEQPLRSLNILKEMLLDQSEIDSVVSNLARELRQDQILTLLNFAVHWNTNSRNWLVAHCVIRIVLERIPPDELVRLPDFRTKLSKLLPYCERHSARLSRLRQQVTFGDFVYQSMKLPNT